MNKGILITLPRHDDVTEYLSIYSKNIADEAFNKGIKFKELKDKEATKEIFEKAIIKLNYSMVIFNGHGTLNSIKGYKDEVITAVNLNEDFLTNRIIYARSCEAAGELGRSVISKSTEGCFIGYLAPFKFWARASSSHNPLKDDVARMFLEPSNLVPISIIKGNNAKEANQNSKKQMLKNINKILRIKDKLAIKIAEDLWNNYLSQTLLGNEAAIL